MAMPPRVVAAEGWRMLLRVVAAVGWRRRGRKRRERRRGVD